MADRSTNLPGPGTEDPSSQASASNPSNRLESWKEIATYLKREVRTVQRWEKREGLPIHRHQHDERSTVYAFKTELDAWWGNGHFRLGKSRREEEVPEEQAAEGSSAKELESRVAVRHDWRFWLAGAAVAVAASAAIFVLKFRPAPRLPLHPKDSILIANFENRTGDPVFDGTLRQGLAAQLEQSPFLHIVSDQRIAGELRLMSQPVGTRLRQDLARQVCNRMGDAAVLDGSIAQIGSQYSLVLEAVNCSTGASLARAEAVANDKNHVLGALGSIAVAMRRKLGESLASIQKFNKPLADVTTPSLEALEAYTLGWQANMNANPLAAVSSLRRAISLDPNFAMAYAVLGTSYSNLGETSAAAESVKRAYKLRARVSEREKFYISSHYQELVTGDLLKADQVFRLWAQTYPRDFTPVGDLSMNDWTLGDYQRGLAVTRHWVVLDADGGSYANLCYSYAAVDRLGAAAAVLQEAKARGFDSPGLHLSRYLISFLQGDEAEMAQEAAWASGKPGVANALLAGESDTAAYGGHLVQANGLTASAITSAEQEGERERAAGFQAEAALREALIGDSAEARRRTTAALKISDGRDTEATAALALALAGGTFQAQRLADDLANRLPEDTVTQFNYLPTVHAAIALGQDAPEEAIADLQAASPYELGQPADSILLGLYPVYMRGLTYLRAHQGVLAAAEFQKILDHPGVALNEIIVPLSHLGLARARALSGDKPGARKAYQAFFTLWRHADPDIPILRQAKAEYAKLQ